MKPLTASRLIALLSEHIGDQGKDLPLVIDAGDGKTASAVRCYWDSDRKQIVIRGTDRDLAKAEGSERTITARLKTHWPVDRIKGVLLSDAATNTTRAEVISLTESD